MAGILARLTTEPRRPQQSRVAYSGQTVAGVPATPDTAVTIPAVWACLRYLSQTVAVLPWHVMRDEKSGGVLMPTHSLDYLLWKRPNPEWSSFQFRETLVHWALRWGNGYAEIEPDQIGRPAALWPIHPERATVCRAVEDGVDDYGDAIPAGAIYYEFDNGSKARSILSAARVFHLRGFGEGPVGVNVIHYAAQSIGWARAAQLFGAAFFGNGMNVSGVVINKKPLKPDGLRRQKAEFDQLYRGPARAMRTMFLDNDADFKSISVDPDKAQFNATQQFLIQEICRWFGVPPHKVGMLDRATFSNIEHQAIEVVVDSIAPWVKRLEDEADWKLFGQNRRGLYTKMNMKALMRGDAAGRIAWYTGMRNLGAYSANDILRNEDENTIGPVGDKRIVQANLTTLEQIGETPAAATVPVKDPPAPPIDPALEEDPPEGGPNGLAEQAAIAGILALRDRIPA
jgi:HK97 family phage portal protein